MEWLLFVFSFLSSVHGPCKATIFGYEGDAHKGGEATCVHRDLRPDEVGIAHRDLPCGTRVTLVLPRTLRWVVARVVDHGPYGAKLGRWWLVKRTEDDPGTWRGCIDMTRRTARILRHNGFEDVIWFLSP